MKAGEEVLLIFVTVIATSIGIWLFSFILGSLLILFIGVSLVVSYSLYKKYSLSTRA